MRTRDALISGAPGGAARALSWCGISTRAGRPTPLSSIVPIVDHHALACTTHPQAQVRDPHARSIFRPCASPPVRFRGSSLDTERRRPPRARWWWGLWSPVVRCEVVYSAGRALMHAVAAMRDALTHCCVEGGGRLAPGRSAMLSRALFIAAPPLWHPPTPHGTSAHFAAELSFNSSPEALPVALLVARISGLNRRSRNNAYASNASRVGAVPRPKVPPVRNTGAPARRRAAQTHPLRALTRCVRTPIRAADRAENEPFATRDGSIFNVQRSAFVHPPPCLRHIHPPLSLSRRPSVHTAPPHLSLPPPASPLAKPRACRSHTPNIRPRGRSH
ncbi:hypothetical protein HYPSUDRAFT_210147 [Hypholoma sublateritium FD-334 SS-4]|uniref:Uncharacterized protein n=1 Tax=Hypholoma sublateritium (strain FD-334 SS-4) TaxID=945553 RepID=A0A0D2NW33_HYPSF|nr:hypothetical protein HYPSUDRAFT_210147 [Hypholoma sublateritium FD-334 SS-4]